MARWRDIKQNKISSSPKKELESQNLQVKNLAGHFDKLKAFLTDTFMIVMPIVYVVVYFIMGDREGFSEHLFAGWAYILIPMGLIIVTLYAKKGQTPGLKAYNLKVIDIKTDEKPSWTLSFSRYVFFTINFLSLFGLFYALFREDKRGIHDLLSGTAIIKDSDESK